MDEWHGDIWQDATWHHAHDMRAMCTTTWSHAWGKSEGVTHESLCHHHLIPHQFEWEKSSEDEIEKERKEGEGKRKGREGERGKKKEPAGSSPTDDASMDGIHRTEKQSSSTRRQLCNDSYA